MNCKVCDNTSAKNPDVSFFRFPSENTRCTDWVERCGLVALYEKYDTIKFHKSFRICSDHFDSKYFMFDGRKKRLLYCAVPQIFQKKKVDAASIDCDKIADDTGGYDSNFKLKLVQNLCRLCAEENRNLTDIFGFRGKSLELETKLKHLPIVISSHDVLPVRICHQCIVKTNELHHFVTNCVKAETKLKIMLDLEGCETTYKAVEDNCMDDEQIGSTEITEDSSLMEANHFDDSSPEISETENGNKLSKTVYVWSTNQSDESDIFLKGNDLLYTNFPAEVESAAPSHSNESLNLNEENCEKSLIGNQTVNIVIERLTNRSSIKEVDFSGHLSLEHDYSNMLQKQETASEEISQNMDSNEKLFAHVDSGTGFKKRIRYSCDTCLKSFSTKELLDFHARAHLLAPDEQGRFICKSCDRAFMNRYNLNEHMRLHSGECPYQCQICDKKFHKFALLKQHLLIHNPEKPYFCSLCNARSNRRGNLIQHMKSHFKAPKVHNARYKMISTCKVCLHMFPNPDDLKIHEMSDHFQDELNRGKSSLSCEICLENFSTPDTYDQHWDSHVYLNFTCGFCKKHFSSCDSLRQHFKSHNEAKHLCQYCNKAFKTREICVTHERSHTGETPYECGDCGKTFRSRPSLHQHRKVHSSKRLFSCNECGMRFKRKDTLNNHTRIHTGERPFACRICGFAFKQRGDCKKHEQNHKRKVNENDVEEEVNDTESAAEEKDENKQGLMTSDQTEDHERSSWAEAESFITLHSYSEGDEASENL